MTNGSGQVSKSITTMGKICVVTICAEVDLIATVSRVTTQLVGSPVMGNMTRYLPQNDDAGLLQALKDASASICIIDFDADRDQAIETARSLHQALGNKLVMIAISRKSSSGLVLDAMRAGCVEYLNKPLDAEQLAQALIRLRVRWICLDTTGSNSQLFAFLGARGGAGSTTLAIHLAASLVQTCGKKVLLVDQQRQLGHIALYMGLPEPKYHFYDLARNVKRLDRNFLSSFLLHAENGVDVIAAPNELFAVSDATVDDIQSTLKFLRSQFEYIIVDCPHGLARMNVATIDNCDKLFVIATPDIPALRDLARYMDRLTQYHFPLGKLNVVINRYKSQGEIAQDQIAKGLKQPIAVTIPNSSSELIAAMNLGKPHALSGNSEFSRQMRKWAAGLSNTAPLRPEPQAKRKRALAFWS